MTAPTRDDLINLRETEGMTREQIAKHYNVSLTTVRRWIKDMNIPRPTKQARNTHASHLTRFGEIVAEPDDGITVMERAETILGARLTVRRGYGYYLDGKPANTEKVIRTAGLKFKDEK